MKIDYIKWYKDLEIELHDNLDSMHLLSSSVYEPTELLKKHLKQFHDDRFETLLSKPNAWGHQTLAENIAKRYGSSPDNIAITNGASNAIYLVCRALLDKGDHVVVESPMYEPMVASPEYLGTEITLLNRRFPRYDIDLNELDSVVNSKTKLVILTNLHNPGGRLLDNSELLQIAEIAKSKNDNIKIVVDEIYRDFAPGHLTPASDLDNCFISLNSLTKVYGLGAVHCGWMIADSSIIEKVRHLQILVEGSGSRLLESLAAIIVENLYEYHNRAIEIVSQNREIFCQHIEPLIEMGLFSGRIPEYGCIYFPRIEFTGDISKLVQILADKYGIYITAGRFFGEQSHIRICFGGRPDLLKAGLEKFVEAVTQIAN